MRDWKRLIRATRWPICLPSALMVIVSFALAQMPLSEALQVAIAVFFIAASTMVVNDYVDREADHTGGRDSIAYDQPRCFLGFTVTMWTLSFLTSLWLVSLSWRFSLLALALCILGIVYSFSRKILLLPSVIVAGTTALAASFPLTVVWIPEVAVFVGVAFLAIFGREEVKNLADWMQDQQTGWKKTLPCSIGKASGSIVARIFWVVAILLLTALPMTSLRQPVAWALSLMILAFGVASLVVSYSSADRAKMAFDLGMTAFLLTATCYFSSPYGGRWNMGLGMALAYVAMLIFITPRCGKVVAQRTAVDDDYQATTSRRNKCVWVAMWCLMGAVIWSLRTLCITRLGQASAAMDDSVYLTVSSLILLAVMLLYHMSRDWSQGRKIINTMSLGLAIGLLAIAGELVSLPTFATAVIVPLCAVVFLGAAHPFTSILKERACQLGIAISIAIVFGLGYAFLSLLAAYIIVVPLYTVRARQQGLPVNLGLRLGHR